MTKKYNITNLNKFLSEERKINEIYDWFDSMVDDYDNFKASEDFTEKEMYKLLDFWNAIQSTYGNSIYEILNEHWQGKKIQMLADFHSFASRYNELKLQNIKDQMTEIEREESQILFDQLWERNQRAEISFSYYDYLEDTHVDLVMNIPRLNREMSKTEACILCHNVILNRGNMLIKLYKPRGQVDYVAITVDEDGFWSCLNETEIASFYHKADHEPFTMDKNENVVTFRHPSKAKIYNHKKMFEGQLS